MVTACALSRKSSKGCLITNCRTNDPLRTSDAEWHVVSSHFTQILRNFLHRGKFKP